MPPLPKPFSVAGFVAFGLAALAAPCLQAAPSAAPPAPQLVLQMGHSQGVWALVAVPGSNRLLTASRDATVKLWDISSRSVKQTWPFKAAVTCLAVSPDGSQFAAATDTEVFVYDIRSGNALQQWQQTVSNVAFTNDRQHLIAQTQSGDIMVWRLEDGALFQSWNPGLVAAGTSEYGMRPFAYSPDGQVVIARRAGLIAQFDAVFGHTRGEYFAPFAPRKGRDAQAGICALDYSKNGDTLAAAISSTQQQRGESEIQIWNNRTGNLRRVLSIPKTQAISGMAISTDGKQVAVNTGQQKTPDSLLFYSIEDGKILSSSPSFEMGPLAISDDGKTTLVASNTYEVAGSIGLYQSGTGKRLGQMAGRPSLTATLPLEGRQQILCADQNSGLFFWNVQTGRLEKSVPYKDYLSTAVVAGPRVLGAGFRNQVLTLWNVESGRVLRVPGGKMTVFDYTFSHNGNLLISAGTWRNKQGKEVSGLEFRDTATDKQVLLAEVYQGYVEHNLQVVGNTLIVCDAQGGVRIWDIAQHRQLRYHRIHPQGAQTHAYGTPSGLCTPNGKIWSAGGSRFRADISEAAKRAFDDFSQRDRTLLEGYVQLYDVQTGKRRHTLAGLRGPVLSRAFTSDSRKLAIGSEGGDVMLWDVATGRRQATYKVGAMVYGLQFLQGNRLLAITSSDGVVRLLNAQTGKLAVTFQMLYAGLTPHGMKTEWIAYTPEGYYEGSAGAERFISWRDAEGLQNASRYQKTYRRPDKVRLALQGLPNKS